MSAPPDDVKPIKPDQAAVSPRQAAVFCGVSPPTIYAWLREGRLASRKLGARRLILLSDLRRLIGGEQ